MQAVFGVTGSIASTGMRKGGLVQPLHPTPTGRCHAVESYGDRISATSCGLNLVAEPSRVTSWESKPMGRYPACREALDG